jgi:glycosyltransferase involved in cell wall biosynthesis
LEERVDTRDKKVIVIPHGCLPVERNLIGVAPDKFLILYVGHRTGYKNFKLLLKAFSIIKFKMPEARLLITGPALTSAEISELNELIGSSDWTHVLNPTDDELRAFYRSASVHVVTSSMEGFGMTILESMSVGTRVLASDIPVFREVGGSETTYFDFTNPEDLSEKLLLEYENPISVQTRLKILNRAESFSWSKSAKAHAEAYKSLIN